MLAFSLFVFSATCNIRPNNSIITIADVHSDESNLLHDGDLLNEGVPEFL